VHDQTARIQHQQAPGVRDCAVQLFPRADTRPDSVGELVSVILLHVGQSLAKDRGKLGAVADVLALFPHDCRQLAQHQRWVQRHVGFVAPVLGNELAVKGDREQAAHAQIHVVVGAGIHSRVKGADMIEYPPPEHHHARHADAVAAEQFRVQVRGRNLLRIRQERRAVAGDVAAGAGDEGERRIGGQSSAVDPQRVGKKTIVGVQKHDELPLTALESRIARRGESLVLLLEIADAITRCNSGGLVRRAVVDHDHLDVGIRLPQHAVDGVREEVRLAETWDHDRDQAWHSARPRRLRRHGCHGSRTRSRAFATRHS
jgi:hypothetical protein